MGRLKATFVSHYLFRHHFFKIAKCKHQDSGVTILHALMTHKTYWHVEDIPVCKIYCNSESLVNGRPLTINLDIDYSEICYRIYEAKNLRMQLVVISSVAEGRRSDTLNPWGSQTMFRQFRHSAGSC